MVCVVCGSNDRTLSPAASSRVRRARPPSTTHTQILCGAPTSPCRSCSPAWLRPRKASLFQLTIGLLTLLVGLLAFWSVSPATIRPFVLHCFLVGRRREEAFPVFVRCRGREAFPEQGPACRKDKPPGKVPAGLLPQSLTARNKDL